MNPRAKFGSVVTSDGSVYVVGGLKGLDLGQQTNRVEVKVLMKLASDTQDRMHPFIISTLMVIICATVNALTLL